MKKKICIIILILAFIIGALCCKVLAAFSLGEKYKIEDDGYITKVEPVTTIKAFAKKLDVSDLIVERNGQDVSKNTSDYICTGDIVTYGGKKYTVIVYGDLNGDGVYSYKDVLLLDEYLKTTRKSNKK